MLFEKAYTDFPTIVHRLIYATALRQTPLSVSLNDDYDIEGQMRDSCIQYHAFVMDMLTRMYQEPQEWGMKAGEYDGFLDGRKENAVKRRFPNKTLALRSETYNTVPSYFRLINRYAQSGELSGGALIIPRNQYADIRMNYDCEYDRKANTEKSIPYATRQMALKDAGLAVDEQADGSVRLTSDIYPDMFSAMSALSKTGWGVKPFGEHNFVNTDFRQIWVGQKHKPCYEDVMQPIQSEHRAVIDEVHGIAEELKLPASCTTFWKVNYHYKGKHVMCIDADDWLGERTGLCNNVRVRVNGSDQGSYLLNIAAKGEDFVKYFNRHLNYCTACSVQDHNWRYDVLGRNVRLCGHPAFRITNPERQDVAYIRQFIELRIEEIRLEKTRR